MREILTQAIPRNPNKYQPQGKPQDAKNKQQEKAGRGSPRQQHLTID